MIIPSNKAETTPTTLATVKICPTTPIGSPKVSPISRRSIPARKLGTHATELASIIVRRILLWVESSSLFEDVASFLLDMASRQNLHSYEVFSL